MAENKKFPGMGFHHINLKASDFDKTVSFYRDALGMTPSYSWKNGDVKVQMMDIDDGGIIEIASDNSGQTSDGVWNHFAIRTDDVDAAYEAAIAWGAESMTPPSNFTFDAQPTTLNIRIAFVYGPDNEKIEFFKIL
ncbi:MAG: VOC family protein [Clostridia bacterium]|nr:VOC family protein [Clostridia bacterium]